jgi:hypothetical protein
VAADQTGCGNSVGEAGFSYHMARAVCAKRAGAAVHIKTTIDTPQVYDFVMPTN